MKDTTPEMEEKVREIIRLKTPQERLEMASSMFALSRKLVIQAILRENPDISDSALRVEFFLKFYGQDYAEEELQKILAALGQCQTPFKRE
jgi:uncharacterized protein YneF (UPF0154 family)